MPVRLLRQWGQLQGVPMKTRSLRLQGDTELLAGLGQLWNLLWLVNA